MLLTAEEISTLIQGTQQYQDEVNRLLDEHEATSSFRFLRRRKLFRKACELHVAAGENIAKLRRGY